MYLLKTIPGNELHTLRSRVKLKFQNVCVTNKAYKLDSIVSDYSIEQASICSPRIVISRTQCPWVMNWRKKKSKDG